VTVWSGSSTAVPCPGVPTAVTWSGSPSTSWSFARTPTVTGVLSGVAAESGLATGASFTGVTVTVTVALAVRPPGSRIT
jgi:hypothetical protein